MEKTYAEQVWQYIVQEVEEGQVVCQTDNESWAVKFCMKHNKSALVRRVLNDEVIYRNF